MADNATEEKYPIQRRSAETERLNTQHHLLVRAAGYLLHPGIQRILPSSPKIAELATGTGIFLSELSELLPPSASLHGYDISPDAFTPSSSLPANVTLSILDAKQPPPSELQGMYDVVLIRFINVALPTPEDWEAVARHAAALLKPGGALQWIEAGFQGLTIVLQSKPETKVDAIEKGTAMVTGMLQHANWYIHALPALLPTTGYTHVKRHVTSTDRLAEDRNPMSQVAIGAVEGLLRRQAAMAHIDAPNGVFKEEGTEKKILRMDEIDALVKEMKEEVDGGAYFRVDVHAFVAWKET